MNIIRMTGGLGNQMFQYALYLRLLSMGKEVKFDDITEYSLANARPIMLWAFGIDYPKADQAEINEITDGFMKLSHRVRRKLFGRRSREYHEKSCNFDRQVLAQDEAYLTGYFQSEKYFNCIEKEVRRVFTFSGHIWDKAAPEFKRKMEEYLEQIRNSVSVSVHIRRGDYLENEKAYGGICTEEYYSRAIEIIKERFPEAVFYVFSNDLKWAGEHYKGKERFVVIEGTDEDTGYMGMFLMSNCKHHIIANSSFSWWGAWLGQNESKKVAAPSVWSNTQDYTDIYTENMIRINAKGELVG